MRTAGYNPPFLNNGGGGGGAVESVTGESPIVSSGGANPEISIGLASDSAFGAVKVDGATITAAAGVISAVGGGGLLLSQTVHITSAQIKDLLANPVVIVPLAAGKALIPIAFFAVLKGVSAPYENGGNCIIAVGDASSGVAAITLDVIGQAAMQLDASPYFSSASGSPTTSSGGSGGFLDLPISLFVDAATDFTAGDGTLDVTVWYLVSP